MSGWMIKALEPVIRTVLRRTAVKKNEFFLKCHLFELEIIDFRIIL